MKKKKEKLVIEHVYSFDQVGNSECKQQVRNKKKNLFIRVNNKSLKYTTKMK